MASRNRKPKQLTDEDIDGLPIKNARYSKVDTEQRGLHIQRHARRVPRASGSSLAIPIASRCGTRSAMP